MLVDTTGAPRSRRSAHPAGMVTSTPRKKGAAPGTTYLNAFTSTISSAVNGVNGHPHQDAVEKEAFVPKTSGDIFSRRRGISFLVSLVHAANLACWPVLLAVTVCAASNGGRRG